MEPDDAHKWYYPEEFRWLPEESKTRRYFRSEVKRRVPTFGVAMDEGEKVRMFESKALDARDLPGQVRGWIGRLGEDGDRLDFNRFINL